MRKISSLSSFFRRSWRWLSFTCKSSTRVEINTIDLDNINNYHFHKTHLNIYLSKMKRNLILYCFLILLGCSSGNDALKVATAANMQFAMEELINTFKADSGLEAEVILSSSGKLTAQIEAGAPFDLFFSADTKYPERIHAKGLSTEPQVYAYGQLVYWEKKNSQQQLYVIANPKTAPYGKATEEYLDAINTELPDVVYGESISQVNQFLLSGTVDAGFTSYSSVLSKKFVNEGDWKPIPDSLHSPIAQAYVQIKSSERKAATKAFIDFLATDKAKDILQAYGYQVN